MNLYSFVIVGGNMIKDKMNVTIPESLLVTVFSMAVVFATLLIISYLVDVLRMILNKKEKKQETVAAPQEVKKEAPVVNIAVQEDDTELVAVITAAIAAMTGSNPSGLVVRNIKRMPESDTSWSKAGKIELMR